MREREKLENISLTYALNDASNKKGRKGKLILPYAFLIDHCALTEEENRTIQKANYSLTEGEMDVARVLDLARVSFISDAI